MAREVRMLLCNLARSFLLTFLLTLVAGCSTIPDLSNPTPLETKPIWDRKRPEFCIALSGGGIRSGAVSLGVLQSLQQQRILQKADIISTVSGGGYPVYGLVASKAENPNLTLDDLLGSGSEHIQRTENTAFIDTLDGLFSGFLGSPQAAFITVGRLLGPTPDIVERASVSFPYAMEIHDTFVGYPAPIGRGITLKDAQPFVDQLKFPYWIIQTSGSSGIRPPNSQYKKPFEDVFELSPMWIGSDTSGYMRSFVNDLRLMDAVVASAAAIDAPKNNEQKFAIPEWIKKTGFGAGAAVYLQDGSSIFLSDGGFIDNQAVVPLLRRNCKLILALDASHDPQADMKGWSILENMLRSRGWQINPPKFSADDHASLAIDAWHLPSNLVALSASDPQSLESTIIVMKLGVSQGAIEDYPKATKLFWKSQLQDWQDRPRCNEEEGLSQRCTFPQQSTSRQYFTPEEFRAYRCLGQFMAFEFMSSQHPRSLRTKNIDAEYFDCS